MEDGTNRAYGRGSAYRLRRAPEEGAEPRINLEHSHQLGGAVRRLCGGRTMGLTFKRQRSLLALALSSLFAVTSEAFAQEQKDDKAPKEPPTPEKRAEWKKEAEARALFMEEAPVEIKLVGNYKVISK